MKAQHRHELETNTLAKELNVWGEKLRPYTSMLLMAVAAALGLYAVLSMWNAHVATREDQAWFEYETAMLEGDPDFQGVRRAAVSDDLAGSRMQEWAHVAWADRQLRRAADEYLVNRKSSKDRLTGVVTIYAELAEKAADSEVQNRARLGLARVRELQGRLDDARKEYARVEGALAPIAEARLKEIEANESEISDASKWLATAELPTPAAPTGPGLPGVRPEFGATPPAAEAGGDPFDPSRTMEDILSGSDDGLGRYGEDAAAGAADAPGEPGATTATEDASDAEPAGDAAPAGDTPASGADATEAGEGSTEPEATVPAGTDSQAPAGS